MRISSKTIIKNELFNKSINGKKYKIPSIKSDKKNIDNFLNKISYDQVIVVQGLGFVGAVMSLVCAVH